MKDKIYEAVNDMVNAKNEKAVAVLVADLKQKYGETYRNIRLEHVDESGYWFSYELEQDSRRQTWCVRHWEVEA